MPDGSEQDMTLLLCVVCLLQTSCAVPGTVIVAETQLQHQHACTSKPTCASVASGLPNIAS